MVANRVMITGATSGIGLALVRAFQAKGSNVIACGRDQNKLMELSSNVSQVCSFDITKPEQINSQSEQVEDIDILVLNAGNCQYIDNVMDFDAKRFTDIIATNLTSLGWQLKYLLPKLKKNGQLVIVSSSASILPFPRNEAYGASKAGVDYLANSLRLDLVKHNIDVTLVHPGFVQTPLTDKNDFTMPFIISSEEAAQRIVKGVDKRKAYLHFPKRLTLLLKLFSILPSFFWQKLILRTENV